MSNPYQNQNLAAVIEDPRARRIIYGVYIIVALALTAATVGFASSDAAVVPEWLRIANAVVVFLGAPVAGLAAVNAPSRS